MKLKTGCNFVQGKMLSGEVEECVEDISARDNRLGKVIFILWGISSLLMWNILLLIAFDLVKTFMPGPSVVGNLTKYSQLGVIITNLSCLYASVLNVWVAVGSFVSLAVFSFLIPIWLFFTEGNIRMVGTIALFSFSGFAVGISQASGFAIATIMPVNWCGSVAVGLSLCGLGSFVLWQSLTMIFDLDDTQSAIYAMGIILWTACVIFAITAFTINYLLRWMIFARDALAKARNAELQAVLDAKRVNETFGQRAKRFIKLIRSVILPLIVVALGLMGSCAVFPATVPLYMDISRGATVLCIGIYQTGDFLGRILGDYMGVNNIFNILNWSPLLLVVIGIIRFGLILVGGISLQVLSLSDPIMAAGICYGYLFLISGTNGFLVWWSVRMTPNYVSEDLGMAAKAKASQLNAVTCIISIGIGLWISAAINTILTAPSSNQVVWV